MNVKFIGTPEVYQMELEILSEHLVRLCPPLPRADLTAGFEILTKEQGGSVFGRYDDYTTVYQRMEDGSLVLSNDGSVWTEPAYKVRFACNGNAILLGETEQILTDYADIFIPKVVPEDNYEFIRWLPQIPDFGKVKGNVLFTAQIRYVPTLEELKAEKKAEVGMECNKAITDGIDVTFPDGRSEHFSLEENEQKHDQINLLSKQHLLAEGAERIEYHEDGKPCKWYLADEMRMIIAAAIERISRHTTYCNSLNMWIAAVETKEELEMIFYGADVPKEYQSEILQHHIRSVV